MVNKDFWICTLNCWGTDLRSGEYKFLKILNHTFFGSRSNFRGMKTSDIIWQRLILPHRCYRRLSKYFADFIDYTLLHWPYKLMRWWGDYELQIPWNTEGSPGGVNWNCGLVLEWIYCRVNPNAKRCHGLSCLVLCQGVCTPFATAPDTWCSVRVLCAWRS